MRVGQEIPPLEVCYREGPAVPKEAAPEDFALYVVPLKHQNFFTRAFGLTLPPAVWTIVLGGPVYPATLTDVSLAGPALERTSGAGPTIRVTMSTTARRLEWVGATAGGRTSATRRIANPSGDPEPICLDCAADHTLVLHPTRAQALAGMDVAPAATPGPIATAHDANATGAARYAPPTSGGE